ncbi:MAG: hypothetical protein A2705_00970 [Omnitrophica WOR_2 bacterium RIFCSPHIGHO2_01_FULL_52_10]|nr:MAG: hypothetical protein A2705_00970 [Omnitrophica WOR_2 bacterium RIFCSPHIGHO2_01_FULL_52_10]
MLKPASKPISINVNIPVLHLKEGDAFICYSPAFDLAAHGDSFEDAEQSFAKTLKLFIEQVTKKGTWANVLEEYGWRKVRKAWNPPRIIGQGSKNIQIPLSA